MRFQFKHAAGILIFATAASTVTAATIYNETVSGDLSNSGLTPTVIAVGVGSNQILGTTGAGATGLDRDYFTISVPSGAVLTGITELPGTTSGGAVSFIGLEAGSQITLPTNAATATELLGWWHYSPADINTNILSKMAIPSNGSSGFTAPLGAGDYAFWIQDFNQGAFNYGFDLNVAASASQTPEPSASALMLSGLLLIMGLSRRKAHRQAT
jgi:hypothetical protein